MICIILNQTLITIHSLMYRVNLFILIIIENMVYDVAEREENEEYEDICMNSLYDEVDSKEDFAKTSSATYDVPICLTYDIPAPATTYDVPQIAAKVSQLTS